MDARGGFGGVTFEVTVDGMTFCLDRKSTRLNSSHRCISYAVFCLKKKNIHNRSKLDHDNRTCEPFEPLHLASHPLLGAAIQQHVHHRRPLSQLNEQR